MSSRTNCLRFSALLLRPLGEARVAVRNVVEWNSSRLPLVITMTLMICR